MEDEDKDLVDSPATKSGPITAVTSLLKNAHKLLGPPLVSMSGKETPQQELAHYLASADLALDGCVLSWWKLNKSLYPQLAKVARNVLAIPG